MEQYPAVNELVLYRKRREPTLAVVISCNQNQVNIITEEGKQSTINTDRIVFRSGIFIHDTKDVNELRHHFRELRDKLQTNMDKIDIYTLWQCVKDVDREVTFEELTGLYSGKKNPDNEELLQLFWTVDKEHDYFKRSKQNYVPSSRMEVNEALLRKERDRLRKIEKDKAVNWALSLIRNENEASTEGFDKDHYIELVKKYIIDENTSPRFKEAAQFVSEIGIKTPEDAVQFLKKLDVCDNDDDPVSVKLSVYDEFRNRVTRQVEDILQIKNIPDDFDKSNFDKVYSIDDESTEDIDDAISFEKSDSGYNVAVHITNVGFYIDKYSNLDREALLRGESVYLPEKTINMLPSELVNKRLSLFSGQPKPVLSLLVNFDDKYNVVDYEFRNTVVEVDENLTYSNSERIFADEDWGIQLKELAYALRQKRIDKNAFLLQLPDFKFNIDHDGMVSMKKNFMDTVPHIVISELMILINYLSAKFLNDNNIPCIYRTQNDEIDEEARNLDRNDPLYPVKILKYLKPSRLSLEPARHSSLGLEYYAQISSPIRRYLDIVIQRQIISYLQNGEPSYSEDELQDLVNRVGSGMIDRRYAQRSRKKYWIFKYLQHNCDELTGYVSSVNERRLNVYFPDILMELPMSSPSEELKEGDGIIVMIKDIDPLRRKINFRFKCKIDQDIQI